MSALLWFMIFSVICGLLFQLAIVVLTGKRRKRAKEFLLYRIKQLRLFKMLNFLGVNHDEYLRAVPVSDINQHIHRCSQCSSQDICDSCLRDGKLIANMNFCPNHKPLIEHSASIYMHRLR